MPRKKAPDCTKCRRYLICVPVSHGGYVTSGSLQDKCSKCGQPVWVSLSSWLIIHDNPEIEILCISCTTAQMKKDREFEITSITPPQAEEIQERRQDA